MKFDGLSIEGWFQGELIFALESKGHSVETYGKLSRDCDIIVDGIGIELKASKKGGYSKLTKAFISHPNADVYLFLSGMNPNLFKKLNLRINEFSIESRNINEKWCLILLKKDL